jgi:hypothetical protein
MQVVAIPFKSFPAFEFTSSTLPEYIFFVDSWSMVRCSSCRAIQKRSIGFVTQTGEIKGAPKPSARALRKKRKKTRVLGMKIMRTGKAWFYNGKNECWEQVPIIRHISALRRVIKSFYDYKCAHGDSDLTDEVIQKYWSKFQMSPILEVEEHVIGKKDIQWQQCEDIPEFTVAELIAKFKADDLDAKREIY